MGAMNAFKGCYGCDNVVLAWAGLERQRRAWTAKFEMRSPRYTTQVDELPVAHAGRVGFRLRSGPMRHHLSEAAMGQGRHRFCAYPPR